MSFDLNQTNNNNDNYIQKIQSEIDSLEKQLFSKEKSYLKSTNNHNFGVVKLHCENPQRAIYDEYRNKSLWKDFNYQPRDYQENRLMGKAARHNGDYSAALKWYYRYVRDKFKR